jgi:hypothetical protein
MLPGSLKCMHANKGVSNISKSLQNDAHNEILV